MLLHESAILIRLYRIPAVATSVLPKPYQPTSLQLPQSVTPNIYRTTLLANRAQPLLEAFGSKEAGYSSLYVYYYFLMIELTIFHVK